MKFILDRALLQCLVVGVAKYEVNTCYAFRKHVRDSVASAASDTHNLDDIRFFFRFVKSY